MYVCISKTRSYCIPPCEIYNLFEIAAERNVSRRTSKRSRLDRAGIETNMNPRVRLYPLTVIIPWNKYYTPHEIGGLSLNNFRKVYMLAFTYNN